MVVNMQTSSPHLWDFDAILGPHDRTPLCDILVWTCFITFLWESVRVPGRVESRKNSLGKNESWTHFLSLLESWIRHLVKRVSFTTDVKEAAFTSATKCRVTDHIVLVRWLSSLHTLIYSEQGLCFPLLSESIVFSLSTHHCHSCLWS